MVEPSEQSVEDLLSAELAFVGGVVALALQGGPEFDGGLEECAGFADGFEVTVQADRPGAVAVAEHPLVHLAAELGHLGAFCVGRQLSGLVVEGFDLFADREVLVGDGAVRYADVLSQRPGVEIAGGDHAYPSARSLVQLAHAKALREDWVRPEQIDLLYLRKPDAEINWSVREGA